MNYIVLDLEWNMTANPRNVVRKPVVLHGEIIQIGAVKLDENYHILDTFKILVSPRCYTTMNRKVSRLTGITTEDLQYGFPFPIAFAHFKKWCGDSFVFLTWGPDDIGVLRDNMILHSLSADWLPNAYNIQIIFDNQIAKENRQLSLSYAMEKIGEPALDAHDALNDARNTACVCMHLDMTKALAEYDNMQGTHKSSHSPAKERTQSAKTYSTQRGALDDPELTNFYCPDCGAQVVCSEFVSQSSSKYISIGKCENGDELFVRFKFTKWADGFFTATRIIYEMDEHNRNYYNVKKQQADAARAAYLQRLACAG